MPKHPFLVNGKSVLRRLLVRASHYLLCKVIGTNREQLSLGFVLLGCFLIHGN